MQSAFFLNKHLPLAAFKTMVKTLYFCLLISLTFPSVVSQELTEASSKLENIFSYNNRLLNSYPSFFKQDGRPKATAGIIYYTFNEEGEGFILLARESIKGLKTDVAGTYSELSGKVEIIHNQVESFLQACIRECIEESAGLYQPTDKDILEKGLLYFSETPQRQVAMVFLKAPIVYHTPDLLKAQQRQTAHSYKEKDDFKWVKINDILESVAFSSQIIKVKELSGKEVSLKIRSYLWDMLKDISFCTILRQITHLNPTPSSFSQTIKSQAFKKVRKKVKFQTETLDED